VIKPENVLQVTKRKQRETTLTIRWKHYSDAEK